MTSALVLAAPLAWLGHLGISAGWLWLFGALGLVPAIDIAVALVNRAVTRGVGASRLPGLALRGGVPEELRTLVAMPVMLSSRSAVEEHLHRLEIHYLASPDNQLHFALLSDFRDSEHEHEPGDDALLDIAILGIARLNRRYGAAAGGERFLLLHRRRLWCDSEQRWMGWERKRGKLEELNRLLRGAVSTSYVTSTGRSPWVPQGVRYVLTLDADTRVPREAPRRLIGKMAHPLNRPRFDPKVGRVVEGYAILQPRVAFSLPVNVEASPFQRVFSGAAGVDPYAAAVSDVYQDLLGEGSFAGKGIYDVDAFEAALADRVPESSLLSHDLFEGIFARAGLASDVEVVEEFPARYDVASLRQHRWVRGDWQLLPWILGRRDMGARTRGRGHARLPLIGLWKMLDNLRRSLSAPASLAALVAGWMLPAPASYAWCGFVVLALAMPTLQPVLGAILPRRSTVTLRSHLRALRVDVSLALAQSALLASMLAYQAWLMGDAIVRTLWRMTVSRRHLLEWIPADLLGSMRADFANFYARMARSVLLALAGLAVVFVVTGQLPALALGFTLLWVLAPAVAWRISRTPPHAAKSELSADKQKELRLIARRTWRFFDTFVTPEENHLPPDNYQEDPRGVVAHRTSPTNIGLYLLSIVAARDFGWCGLRDALDRIESTLETIERMPKFRGHLYNWYDTQDLRPLEPRYVSSVDSGNLAAHLITLAGACREWQENQEPDEGARAGLADTFELARESLRAYRFTPGLTITRGILETAFADLEASLRPTAGIEPTDDALATAAERASTLVDMVRTLASETPRGARFRSRVLGGGHAAHDRQLAQRPAGARSGRVHRRAPGGARRPVARDRRGDGVRLPARHAAQAAVDRLPRHRRHARSVLLRPARLRGAAGEFHRDREGRRARAALVPARPHRDADRRRCGARVVVGLDVRIPHAGPRAARAGRQPAGADQPPRREAPDATTVRSSDCPGAFPSPRTTRAISSSPINTRTSACRGWASSAGCPRTR